jgi:hypothetical protein
MGMTGFIALSPGEMCGRQRDAGADGSDHAVTLVYPFHSW